jgi:uncharacterized membrane protein
MALPMLLITPIMREVMVQDRLTATMVAGFAQALKDDIYRYTSNVLFIISIKICVFYAFDRCL